MSHSLALAYCACYSPPTSSFLLASALVFQSALSGSLHSLDSVLGSLLCQVQLRTIGPWVAFGLQGPEEAVLDLRIQGSLQHSHHLILLHFRNCLSLDMFVWSSYECHSISLPSRYQR